MALHLCLLIGQFVVFHFQAATKRQQAECFFFPARSNKQRVADSSQHSDHNSVCGSPVILGLEELELIFNPVTRLCYSEFEAGLAGLMWSLKGGGKRKSLKE